MNLSLIKLETVSEICRDIAQVFFASVFIDPFFAEKSSWLTISFGLLLALIFWSFSLLLIKKYD
jgi:hypothetical protein